MHSSGRCMAAERNSMSNDRPDLWRLVRIPALLTLGITLLRLVGDFLELPGWLASRAAGGDSAIIGIVWLAPIFGVYFARKLAHFPGSLWKHLVKTMFVYGLTARIPVVIIMGFAIFGEWNTHYDAFPPDYPFISPTMKFLIGGVVTQLVVWVVVWTVGTGTLFGLLSARLVAPQKQPA